MQRNLVIVIIILLAAMLPTGCTQQAKYIQVDKDAKLQLESYIQRHEQYSGKLEIDVKYGTVTFTIVETGEAQDVMSQMEMGGWAANKWHQLMKELGGRKNWKGDLVFRGKSIAHYTIDKKGLVNTNVYGNDSI